MPDAVPALTARDAELAALEDELSRARSEGPRAVLVSGPTGAGRTALLDALAARHSGPVLRARAASWEAERPYAVLGQLVAGAAPTDPLAGGHLLAGHLTAGGEPDRYEAALVLLDDAQWADLASLQALDSAVRHDRDARFLVVLAAAADRPEAASAQVLDLVHRCAAVEVPLPPLTSRQVAEVAAAHGVLLHPSMAERLQAHTGGLPRHVVQLLAELPRQTWARFDPELPAPAAVAARVRAALAGCGDAARRLAEAAAVLGPDAPVAEAARLAGVDGGGDGGGDGRVVEALEEAQDAGLLAAGPQGMTEVGPADPMVRAAVLTAMGPSAVATTRRRAAELVENPVRRLHLLVEAAAMPDAALADELEEAATSCAADGGWALAASLLIDASRLTDDRLQRERRLTRAVDALVGAGDGLGAAALVAEVESLRETALRNAVLGYLAVIRGRVTEAETRLHRAWELVNVEREPEVAALISQRYVLHALARCRGEELVAWADRATALVEPDDPAAVEAAAIRGLGLLASGRRDEALAAYEELGGRVSHGAQGQRVAMGRGWMNLVLDAVDDARTDLESAVPTTFHGGSARISLWARAWLARVQFLTGEWDEALRTVQEGSALLEHTGIVLTGPLLHWTAVQVHALRGSWDLAEASLRHTDVGGQAYEIMRVPSYLARAQIAEAQADYAGVLRALHPLTQQWARGLVDEPGQWPWADVYANALVIEGRLDEAETFLDRHEALARAREHASTQARLGYARGRLLGARGDLRASRVTFERSLALLEDLPLRWDRARVEFAYGQTLRRAGRRREADTVMSAARDLYASLGATTYVARCEREIKAGGVRASRVGRAVDELTPQEEAVTRLVARGLSNQEVAAEMFLSTKTVQYHLTRVYAKLGIRSRAELAALRAPGSGPDEG